MHFYLHGHLTLFLRVNSGNLISSTLHIIIVYKGLFPSAVSCKLIMFPYMYIITSVHACTYVHTAIIMYS